VMVRMRRCNPERFQPAELEGRVDLKLSGKRALVTGGTAGIGEAIGRYSQRRARPSPSTVETKPVAINSSMN
jgi:hypothetical protein